MVETLTKATKSQDAERAQEKKRQLESAPVFIKALADESVPFAGLLGVSAMDPTLENHAAFLGDPRFSHPANNTQKVGLVTGLQQTYGNRYVQHLIESLNVQAKLTVGSPDDQYEREADRVADAVTRASTSNVHRQVEEKKEKKAGKEEEEEPIQIKGTGGQIPLISSGLQPRINSLRGGGHPLSESTRSYFEPRFGVDFTQIRVHTDAKAAEKAQALNVCAFTKGRDIVFGVGQYVPNTHQGRRLLAHELRHVVQQGSNHTIVQRQGTPPITPATNQDRRESVRWAIRYMNKVADHYRLLTKHFPQQRRLDKTDLTRNVDGLRRIVETNIRLITDFLQGDQALQRQLRQAYQNAVGALIGRTSQQLKQTPHQVYQDNRARIPEWAWPQAAQDAAAHSRSAALPAPERIRIKVISTDFNLENLHDLFSTQGGRTIIPLPRGVRVTLGGAIPQGLQHGLRNVAGSLVPNPLAINSTITLALDLERYGGDYGAYRFTYVEHRPRRGPRTREVIIERLGSIGIEGLPESQSRLQLQRFQRFGFKRGDGWESSQFEALLTAIAQVPDRILAPVSGLTFNRAPADPDNPDTGGKYNPQTHTIIMYNRCFDVSLTRYGTPGAAPGIHTAAVRNIVHEIGHAIDLLPLRRAWQALEQAQDVLHTAFREFEKPRGSKQYSFPNTEQARWNRLHGQLVRAQLARSRARSASGARWRLRAGAWEVAEFPRGARNTDFRRAAFRDGARPPSRRRVGAGFPTSYPNIETSDEWWQEYFAESFSLYITSPTVLQQLRPRVYAYFVTNFPRQQPRRRN